MWREEPAVWREEQAVRREELAVWMEALMEDQGALCGTVAEELD